MYFTQPPLPHDPRVRGVLSSTWLALDSGPAADVVSARRLGHRAPLRLLLQRTSGGAARLAARGSPSSLPAPARLVLRQCVAQAHADVNEAYPRQNGGSRFKNGKFPNDAECDRAVRFTHKGLPVTLAQELGILKHAAAFACVKDRLSKDFGDNFSVEPRYKGNPDTHGVVLTNDGPESLVPDLVVHAIRDATNVQCVYEFKFPCHEKHRLNPMDAPGVKAQLHGYQKLSNRCPVALVTPSGLKQLGVD